MQEIEQAMELLAATAGRIPALFRAAEEIAYTLESSFDAKGAGSDSADPTAETVMAGLLNREDEDQDRWNPERTTLWSAVDAIATAVAQLGLAHGRLASIIRTNERRGMAADRKGKGASRTFSHLEAERLAEEFAHRPLPDGLTDRRYWPRRRAQSIDA